MKRLLVFVTVTTLVGCGGIEIDQDLVLCMTTCKGECVRSDVEGGGQAWVCRVGEPPPPPPDTGPQCPDMAEIPWAHEVGATCSTPERPVKHQPPGEPCPLLVDLCPQEPPDGGPPSGDVCVLPTPTARELVTAGKRVEIKPRKEGKKVGVTPLGEFGWEYYCAIGWTDACAKKRTFGPVAPDGDTRRIACEQHFLGAPCPTLQMGKCLGDGNQCPITFDPFFVIDGVNQNHPRNVAAGCRTSTWKKNDEGHVVQGEMQVAIPSGKGTILACTSADADAICTESTFKVDQ